MILIPSRPERSEGSLNIEKGEKDTFLTNPKRQKINFGRSWRRGLFPPPLMVMSNEVRHLLIQSKGVKVPLSNLPQKKTLNSFGRSFEGVMSNPLNLKIRPLFVSLIWVTDIGKGIHLPN